MVGNAYHACGSESPRVSVVGARFAEGPLPTGGHQGPLADEPTMAGCCGPENQYGDEDGTADCDGHQVPGPSMEGMAGGGRG
jgi:hypothetical protein